MKNKVNIICSVLALLCFVSLFIPVIALRYPAAQYHAQPGNNDFFFSADYYMARSYWAITDYVFGAQPQIWRIVLSFDQALLLFWSVMSVRGEAGKMGLPVAILNLAVTGTGIIKMASSMWACQWAVLIMMVLDAIAAVVMAAVAGAGKRARQ